MLLSPQAEIYMTGVIIFFHINSPIFINCILTLAGSQFCVFVSTTTHSTWHEPLQAMFGFVLQFGGVRGVGGAYRGICQHTVYRVLQR